jgi:hypothetical protein
VMSEKERLITAYHEMGHALVGHFLEFADPVHKISVISRGQALGYTISMPQEDRFLTTRAELKDTMAMTLGGRAAEEIVFGEITTGASNDIEKVTQTAKQMVMRFGMSERLGPRVFGHDHGQPFLGREFSTEPDYSDEIAREIDDEVRRIIEAAHQRATDILTEHRHDLEKISEILVKRETIEKEEFLALLDGKSEEAVFGVEEDSQPELPAPPAPADRPEREAPRVSPRPGYRGDPRGRQRASRARLTVSVKLHRCSTMWVKGPHPCWQVQKALDEQGIEYEVVRHPAFPRGRRKDYIALTGQKMFPAIELEDGRVVREDSSDLAERIREGRLSA